MKECWEALDVALGKTEDIAFARDFERVRLESVSKNALVCFDELGFCIQYLLMLLER